MNEFNIVSSVEHRPVIVKVVSWSLTKTTFFFLDRYCGVQFAVPSTQLILRLVCSLVLLRLYVPCITYSIAMQYITLSGEPHNALHSPSKQSGFIC